MLIDDVRPHHCLARAQRLLAEVGLVRDELGRAEDARPALAVTDARPRACYFEALATWHKVDRLAAELGLASDRLALPAPAPTAIVPGHVLQVIDAVLARIGAIRARLSIAESVAEPGIEEGRQPSDVLTTLVRINRQLSRCLERPFTPGDVYGVVAMASSYAARLGATADLAPFERGRRPADCYRQLAACHATLAQAVAKHGEPAVAIENPPTDVLPGDVYDLAWQVVGELAFLHARDDKALPVYGFEPTAAGHRLPSHVDQLARTLAAQLAALS